MYMALEKINPEIEQIADKLFNRDAFVKYFRQVVAQVAAPMETISNLNQQLDMGKLRNLVKSSRGKNLDIYMQFNKRLVRNAATRESKVTLDSIHECLKVIQSVMMNIDGSIPKIFPKDKNTIANMRVSQAMVIGFVRKVDTLTRWISYLINGITADLTDMVTAPKYRLLFLENNLGEVVELVNDMTNRTGSYEIIKDLNSLKNNEKDVKLMVDNQPATGILASLGLKRAEKELYTRGISSLTPLRPLLEMVNIVKHWWIKHEENERDWLDTHVATLKMKLDGVNPSSPEYQRTAKIIEKYNDQRTILDQKLKEYYES